MEKLTLKSNQRDESNLGRALLEVLGAVLVVVGLYIILNLALGWN
jgi:hypothetical protein